MYLILRVHQEIPSFRKEKKHANGMFLFLCKCKQTVRYEACKKTKDLIHEYDPVVIFNPIFILKTQRTWVL